MLKDALTLSALIAAVLLVRSAFKNRVPKRLIYALWLVVLLKLCLPGTAVRPAAAAGGADSSGAADRNTGAVRARRAAAHAVPLRSRRTPAQQPASPTAGGGKTGGSDAARDRAGPRDLVLRQRAARPLAASYVAGLYRPAAQEPPLPRQARPRPHLRRGQHFLALPRGADPGGLSDRRRGAERCGGARPAPRADAPAASGSPLVVLPRRVWSRSIGGTRSSGLPRLSPAATPSWRATRPSPRSSPRRSVWPTRAPFWRRPRARRPR